MANTAQSKRSYASGARILSLGIASTGVFTFAYFSLASHVLDNETAYGAISTLWAILFVVISVIYRPVEQLLSRTIAQRRARGLESGHPLRGPLLIQGSFALVFLLVSLLARPALLDVLDHDETLYWLFVGSALAYAASYFARGFFAGHEWFGLYGGLVLFESISRFCFPLAVGVGFLDGPHWVAAGILAAPLVSLIVVPLAISRMRAGDEEGALHDSRDLTLAAGAGFAVSVAAIQLGEQALINVGVLTANVTAGEAAAGVVFSALMIVRAPLQLFQAIQTSLLPHLTGLHTVSSDSASESGSDDSIEPDANANSFDRTIRVTVLLICAFAGLVALGLLAIGPWVMDLLFSSEGSYGRFGLALLGVGMGLHLSAGTLNQAALARGHDRLAAVIWLCAAAVFTGWMLLPTVADELLRAELGYTGAAGLLALGLWLLYRMPQRSQSSHTVRN